MDERNRLRRGKDSRVERDDPAQESSETDRLAEAGLGVARHIVGGGVDDRRGDDCSLDLDGAHIDRAAVEDSSRAGLIGREWQTGRGIDGDQRVIAPVDGRAEAKQGMRLGGAAVVGQGAQTGVCHPHDVAIHAVGEAAGAMRVADQVVPASGHIDRTSDVKWSCRRRSNWSG